MADRYLLPCLLFTRWHHFNSAQITYADYVVMLRIKWPRSLPRIVKIRAAFLNLLAEMSGPV